MLINRYMQNIVKNEGKKANDKILNLQQLLHLHPTIHHQSHHHEVVQLIVLVQELDVAMMELMMDSVKMLVVKMDKQLKNIL